ncbi:MAG: fructose-6-phosphate aldolase [Clostridia bacterium]|nr:fructose-6-phosphate aldolase [Clostridia bacterium]
MKIFIDTANVEEIRRANELGVICGVTTNPSLIAREGRDFIEVVKEIAKIVDGPISAEVVSLTADEMVDEACALCKKIDSPNIVIKIPMCAEGLKATKRLHEMGIKTNVTLVFSTAQALLAAKAGATYVSPFVGRLDDIGGDGIALVNDIASIFQSYGIETEIIAASIRTSAHVTAAARAGSNIATVPYKVIESMIAHPLTSAGIERFLADWSTVENK